MLIFLVWIIACVVTFMVFPLLGIGLFVFGLFYMIAVDLKKTARHLAGLFRRSEGPQPPLDFKTNPKKHWARWEDQA